MREYSSYSNNNEGMVSFSFFFLNCSNAVIQRVKGTESQYDKLLLREKGPRTDYFFYQNTAHLGETLEFICENVMNQANV